MASKPNFSGPGEFFAAHPLIYAISLLGALSAAILFSFRARQSTGARRLVWIGLALFQIAQAIGLRQIRGKALARLD